MNFLQLNNEKGFTLVELLAAIGLLAIVIALSTSVLMQTMGNENETSEDISLKQKTNVLISEMKNQFYNGDRICFEGLYVDLQVTAKLTNNNDTNYKEVNGCFQGIDYTQPAHLVLTVSNQDKQPYKIKTTWNNTKPILIPLTKNNNDGLENDEDGYSSSEGNCIYQGDTVFNKGNIADSNQMGIWNSCPNPHVKKGRAWFPDAISIYSGIFFTIDKDLFIDKSFFLEESAELLVKQSVRLKGTTILKSRSNLTVNNNLIADAHVTLQESSKTHIFNNSFFNNGLKLMRKATLEVGGSLNVEEPLSLQESNTITVGKNANFSQNVTMQSNAILHVRGDAHFYNNLDLHSGVKIIIEGDATFDGPITPNWSYGSICVKGSADIKKTIGPNINLTQNDSSCGR